MMAEKERNVTFIGQTDAEYKQEWDITGGPWVTNHEHPHKKNEVWEHLSVDTDSVAQALSLSEPRLPHLGGGEDGQSRPQRVTESTEEAQRSSWHK